MDSPKVGFLYKIIDYSLEISIIEVHYKNIHLT